MALASFIEESPISERLAVTVISDDAGQQRIRIQNKSASTVRLIGGNACWGVSIDLGARSLPIRLSSGKLLEISVIKAQKKMPIDFDLFFEAKNELLKVPVKAH